MDYNRETSLAILTGIVCGLIFLSATILGAFYNISTIGWIGIFSAAGLVILDFAIIWASYIDYHEDGTLLEYVAWTAKGFGAAYLLFYGGCLIFVLSEKGFEQGKLQMTNKAAVNYLKECKESGMSERTCRETAKTKIQEENKSFSETKPTFADEFVHSPVSKIAGPILGLFFLLALGLTAKFSKEKDPSLSGQTSVSLRTVRAQPPFTAPPAGNSGHSLSFDPVEFLGGNFTFKRSGERYVIWLRLKIGAQWKDFYIGRKPMLTSAECGILVGMSGEGLAKEILTGSEWSLKNQEAKEYLEKISKKLRVP